MARVILNDFLRRLSRGASASILTGHSDAQLVERALTTRDEAAFEAIVLRHGPMVYRVCWRNLEHSHDAEDAFQAVFLVLARRLSSLRKQASLASWLHGVAHRVALKARARAASQRRREHAAPKSGVRTTDDVTWRELRTALDCELSRLPTKWRQPLILCYLEGRTQDEAAAELAWSKSTLRRRLEEARTALGKRLAARDILVTGALTSVLLSESTASAALDPAVVTATVEVSAGFIAGRKPAALAPSRITNLSDGVLRTMFLSKIHRAMAPVLALAMLITGIAGLQLPSFADSTANDKDVKQESKPSESADDAKLLQGEWRVVDAEKNGKPISEDPRSMHVNFKSDTVTIFGLKSKFRLETTKTPRELYLELLEGASKGVVVRSIYSINREELKVCIQLGEKSARATEFKTKTGDGLLYLVLHRAGKDDEKLDKSEDVSAIKRPWTRPDAPPDGNYRLWFVEGVTEFTTCLIKLETKDGKQSATLVGSDEEWKITAMTASLSESPSSTASPAKGVNVRIALTIPRGDLIFRGSFTPDALEAKGYLEVPPNGGIFPAILSATELTKLRFTEREIPDNPLKRAYRLGRASSAIRQNAKWAKEGSQEKKFLQGEAAKAEKRALEEGAKLYHEGFEKYADQPVFFEAGIDAAQHAEKYHIAPDELRSMIAIADKTAATYGRRVQQELDARVAPILAARPEYLPLAVDMASRLEKELQDTDATPTRIRILKAIVAVGNKSKAVSSAKERLAPVLARVEASLDNEYRAKVPPFKPEKFAGRKGKSDRVAVLELFTGTQCPPCVGATVAFDALREAYKPSELVLIEYHMHIPGPDPLTCPASEGRWDYYSKTFPKDILGVPTTLFNGKPAEGGGGTMEMAEGKCKKYRAIIDPLLETASGVKLSATAVLADNKVQVTAEVSNLKKQSDNLRLRLLLVEETVRYVGGNQVRLHHNVVRGVIGSQDGFAVKDGSSTQAAIDLTELRNELTLYLADCERERRPFPNSDRPLDLSNLRVIALVQDDATREIMQAVQVDVLPQVKRTPK